jgi:hypothetical protein
MDVKRGSAVAAELSEKMATAASNGNEQQVMDCSRAATGRWGKQDGMANSQCIQVQVGKGGSAPSEAEASAYRWSTRKG